MAYCTSSEVAAFAQGQTINSAVLDLLLEPVSTALDRYCRRTFTATEGSRFYAGTNTNTLRLDAELCSLTQITAGDGSALLPADVVLEPQSGPPYLWVRRKGANARFTDTGDEAAITVTGKWGYAPSVPPVVKLAAILWVLELHNTGDVIGFAGVSGGSGGYTLEKALSTPPARVLALGLPRRVRVEGV